MKKIKKLLDKLYVKLFPHLADFDKATKGWKGW